MDKFDIQKLRDLPIEGVAERLGLDVRRHKCLCPFHDDHHASLTFSLRRNSFRCFACGASGGTIDLVMKYLNVGFKEACRFLDERRMTKDEKLLPLTSSILPHTSFDASRYERFFERPWLNEEARRFLFDVRKLDARVVRWCRLTSWRDRRGIPWLQIPYYDREGRLVGIQNRNLSNERRMTKDEKQNENQNEKGSNENENENQNERRMTKDEKPFSNSHILDRKENRAPRFRFPQGSECGIYNLPVLNRLAQGEELWITEGCSDCWAMLSSGHKAIAIPSATLLKPKDVELLSSLHSQLSTPFHMYPDNDVPGERLFLQLQEVLPGLVRHQLPPGCKDFSELFLINVTRK